MASPWPHAVDRAAVESWRAVIAVLREKALPSMLERANYLEQQLEQHPPDQPIVSLNLSNDAYLRSYT